MKRFSKFLKPVVSFALLFYVFSQIETEKVDLNLNFQNLAFFTLAVLITLSNNYFAALRLNVLVSKKTSLLSLTKLNFIGSFFSLFLPTNFGGDVFRIRYLRPKLDNYQQATATIFLDRFLGLSVILLFANFGTTFLYLFQNVTFPLYIYLFLILINGVTILAWASILSNRLLIILNSLKKIEKINSTHEYISQTSIKKYLVAFFWSIVVQLNVIMYNFFLAQAINLEIPIYYFFVIIPITNLFLAIPISFNGLGVRDFLFINLFDRATSSQNLFILGPINFLGNVINGVVGGVIYSITDREKLWKDD